MNTHKGERIKGKYRLWSTTDSGLIVPGPEGSNLIVREGRRTNAHFLGESVPVEDQHINAAKLGTLGWTGTTNNPVPPEETDTVLEDGSPQAMTMVSRVYLPEDQETSVLFLFSLAEADGNGAGTKIYTEAGLFKADGLMYARITFPGHVKDNTRKLYLEWTIL